MARRTLNRHELRAAVEAAEALGINPDPARARKPREKPTERRSKPGLTPRMRVVWAVCDMAGRTVATFDYPCKADAEALVASLKAQKKGAHFVRSVKEPMAAD